MQACLKMGSQEMPEQLYNMIQQWTDALFPILVCGLTNAVCLQSFDSWIPVAHDFQL